MRNPRMTGGRGGRRVSWRPRAAATVLAAIAILAPAHVARAQASHPAAFGRLPVADLVRLQEIHILHHRA
jgi:hypothetical protein